MTQPSNKLSNKQLKFLRGEAHSLKPVIMVGDKGVTESVMEELSRALDHHELIKIKVRAEDREEKNEMIDDICAKANAHKVHVIGHNLVLFKQSAEKKVALPRR